MNGDPCMRGLIIARPLSLALWGLIYGCVREAIPPPERHSMVEQAHYDLAEARHDMRALLVPRA